jgi:hypothetical protein
MRSAAERIADVRRLLEAARRVHGERARLVDGIARSTGLTPEGVELGFDCLERDATDADLGRLVERAGDARHVHVVLSANVFVAPMRALALARAAAPRVTVRPSPRDPLLAEALVEAAGDRAIAIVGDREVGSLDCSAIHVYGRDATIAAVRVGAAPGVEVRGHGAGLGVVMVSEGASEESAAARVAPDVVLFDQRGCMSPRVVVVLGSAARAEAFAAALDEELRGWGVRVPRGTVHEAERVEATRWQETLQFAGRLWSGAEHAVGLCPSDGPVAVPPAARHVAVVNAADWEAAGSLLAPFARFVVAIGSDDAVQARDVAPPWARVTPLGGMQRVPLDGPVDLRES